MTDPKADILVQNDTPALDFNINSASCHILRPKRLKKSTFSGSLHRPQPREPSEDITARLSIEVVITLGSSFVKLLALTVVAPLNLLLERLSGNTRSNKYAELYSKLLVAWKELLLAAARSSYVVPLVLTVCFFRASFHLVCQAIGVQSRQGQRRGTRPLRHDEED